MERSHTGSQSVDTALQQQSVGGQKRVHSASPTTSSEPPEGMRRPASSKKFKTATAGQDTPMADEGTGGTAQQRFSGVGAGRPPATFRPRNLLLSKTRALLSKGGEEEETPAARLREKAKKSTADDADTAKFDAAPESPGPHTGVAQASSSCEPPTGPSDGGAPGNPMDPVPGFEDAPSGTKSSRDESPLERSTGEPRRSNRLRHYASSTASYTSRPTRESSYRGTFRDIDSDDGEQEQEEEEEDEEDEDEEGKEEEEEDTWNAKYCLSIRPFEWDGRDLQGLPPCDQCETLLEWEGNWKPTWEPLSLNARECLPIAKYMHVLEPTQRPNDYAFPEGFNHAGRKIPRYEMWNELVSAREQAAQKYPGMYFVTVSDGEEEDSEEEDPALSSDGPDNNSVDAELDDEGLEPMPSQAAQSHSPQEHSSTQPQPPSRSPPPPSIDSSTPGPRHRGRSQGPETDTVSGYVSINPYGSEIELLTIH
ncbi:hypothetical protein B0J12DRAFT_787346 [Macrophomina phaseolina]|uniref:Chromo domain-containing protein n=1 Tax=Macrophomina phaseolina TaxID=35725 RepID=A0ABQ8G4J1_9PEZI|nr:hypothetical protein B0J12DRAFT_787346 [Macrophomina phaseolina]